MRTSPHQILCGCACTEVARTACSARAYLQTSLPHSWSLVCTLPHNSSAKTIEGRGPGPAGRYFRKTKFCGVDFTTWILLKLLCRKALPFALVQEEKQLEHTTRDEKYLNTRTSSHDNNICTHFSAAASDDTGATDAEHHRRPVVSETGNKARLPTNHGHQRNECHRRRSPHAAIGAPACMGCTKIKRHSRKQVGCVPRQVSAGTNSHKSAAC